ncbi:hypothetical protein DFH11DRAFT_116804 [Phellopilus nigrolimitatus]|nr:hypothetical protein DFH11DRAFT_116804 [Phellopilus nigrolimitatus]
MADNNIIQREPPVLQRIPPEVLLEIFFECLFSRPHHTLSHRQAPLNVSQTCRYWRNVALSSSKLWAHLDLCSRESSFQHDQLQYFLATMNTWFFRSNKVPLSFNMFISIPENSDEALRSTTEKVVSSLFRQQCRWKDIKLACSGLRFSENFNLEATSMPLIESLQLSFPLNKDYLNHPLHFDGILDLGSSLRLKDLNYGGSFLLEPSGVSLLALTHCAFSFKSPHNKYRFMDVCLDLLHLAPNLESFNVDFCGISRRPPVPPSPMLVLHHLRTLRLEKSVVPILLIEKLTLPSLVDLRISAVHHRSGPVLLDFMHRSQPPLESLTISDGCPEDDELLDVLHLLPTLRSLTIKTAVLSNYFLIRMISWNPWEAPCLALQDIRFHDVSGWDGQEELIGEMLVSRWCAPGGLKKAVFSLVKCDVNQMRKMQSVRRCVEEGLQLMGE